jgi:hypothetical protein
MTWGEAIRHCRAGIPVRRLGWNDESYMAVDATGQIRVFLGGGRTCECSEEDKYRSDWAVLSPLPG